MRYSVSFHISEISSFKEQLLLWGQQFEHTVWMDTNDHDDRFGSYDALFAADAISSITQNALEGFGALANYRKNAGDWIFGFMGYDLKNDIESLSSHNTDGTQFPELAFFQPKRIIVFKGNKAHFMYLKTCKDDITLDFKAISEIKLPQEILVDGGSKTNPTKIRLRIFKEEYFKKVEKILAHIRRGDIYEVNFCQEFYAEDTVIDPRKTYENLNAISKAPFAAFVKIKDCYLLCASPERYLKKVGQHLISQPIKGTAKRSSDTIADKINTQKLESDPKERSENIMIVDLVRNDLSKSAIKGSVKVEELCKTYTYAQVHQMVSTVTAEVNALKDPVEIIKETFPMGSMTGAPKLSAMKVIEAQESFKRGLYSGSVGYFSPEGDFDFNVVIRSILYNASRKYVSFSVGSAITAMASPEKEYEECLLKAKAMREVLEN